MVQQVCTEHLWGRIVVTATGEKPKKYTMCVNCGCLKPDEKASKFFIEENLEVIENENIWNAENYFNK